jgi:hypothetical protein
MRGRAFVALGAIAAIAAFAFVSHAVFSGGSKAHKVQASKFASDPDANSASATAGEGPVGGWDAYLAAAEAYPASGVTPDQVQKAEDTFASIASRGDQRFKSAGGKKWDQVSPKTNATEPGVLAFSGATNTTASRTTALAVDPDCKANKCRVWIGAAGGGVWKTEDATDNNPDWKQVKPKELDQNSVGVLTLDPGDKKHDTLYLGTGEANRCGSGCEAGVGIYKSKDGGGNWDKLPAACVSNPTYACVTPGVDAFLGRGIRAIVIDPNNKNHIFVGSAQAVRGLSHVIGIGGGTRFEPGANAAGLYESSDGGNTFTMIWNGNSATSFGINDVELDPLNTNTVYASAFDAGLWRRPAGAAATAFEQIFVPQFIPPFCVPSGQPAPPGCAAGGTDRLMFAPTVKNGKTRIYLTEGTANPGAQTSAVAANFWRIDDANQTAAALRASQVAGNTTPTIKPFPAFYGGWQKLTDNVTSSPYYATVDFCTAQCWYDQNVYTPAGLPDTVYVIGSYYYNELPCNTKGVGCNTGRSNGRAVLYSNTAGDPDGAATGPATNRTFTDLTWDAQNNPADWCALGSDVQEASFVAPGFTCSWAPGGIHPDQHVIAVNPGNPTQIFEGSDGGLIRTTGAFADISSHCNSNERGGLGAASLTNCARLLSRVPTRVDHINKKYSSTIQFINVAIDPFSDCEVLGGTQDNGTWSNQKVDEHGLVTGKPDDCDDDMSQRIYGDGGNAGYDSTTPGWMFNEFTGGFSDSNFRDGEPTKWVISSAPLVNSGEAFAFYWPQIADPNPTPGAHPIYSGGKSVWRTWAFGAGVAGHVPQDKSPDIATYEANCQEFTVSGAQQGCGDYRPLGGPYCDGLTGTPTIPSCANAANDLTGSAYGGDRAGGSVSWISRTAADHGTVWASTSAGRVFVSHNADASDPATVTWHRIDNSASGGSPTRYPSGIYVDPDDSGHAWIAYSGYNANTAGTPGHVFEVREGNPGVAGSGTFTNLNVEAGTSTFPTPTNDGDLPVADVVRDDANHVLYAATDFGVLKGLNDGKGGWFVTEGMPRYEVMHLEVQPSSRAATCATGKKCKPVLYAATHSQGIWKLKLDG